MGGRWTAKEMRVRNEVWGWNAGEGGIKRRIYVFLYLFLANPLIYSRFPTPYTSSSYNSLLLREIFFPSSYTETGKMGEIGTPWVGVFLEGGRRVVAGAGRLEGGWKVWGEVSDASLSFLIPSSRQSTSLINLLCFSFPALSILSQPSPPPSALQRSFFPSFYTESRKIGGNRGVMGWRLIRGGNWVVRVGGVGGRREKRG